jgi:hypothetical protein
MVTRKQAWMNEDLARLGQCDQAELQLAWEQHEGCAAPNIGPAHLRRLLAYRLQERQFGGLPAAIARELDRAALASNGTSRPRARTSLPPGSRLVREWNGQTITVEVRDAGFVWNDRTYRSLSEIARKVTGAHWSGPRFFGLNRRG